MRWQDVRSVLVVFAGLVCANLAHANVVTIRTGQVGSAPGSCPGVDDSFHVWAGPLPCEQPLSSSPFTSSDFDSACAGPQAFVLMPDFPWAQDLACDRQARWVGGGVQGIPLCFGESISALYCASFDSRCPWADSIKVCWQADDRLGDPSGPNAGGIYVNGVSLGPAFSGGNAYAPTTAVAYHVPLVAGANKLEVYQRDTGCSVAGVILSANIYMSCLPVPVHEGSWGLLKARYK